MINDQFRLPIVTRSPSIQAITVYFGCNRIRRVFESGAVKWEKEGDDDNISSHLGSLKNEPYRHHDKII